MGVETAEVYCSGSDAGNTGTDCLKELENPPQQNMCFVVPLRGTPWKFRNSSLK
jgi:hypothetical protein